MSDETTVVPTYRVEPDEFGIDMAERTKPGFMGRVEIKAVIDDPGAPDHGKVVSYLNNNTITFDARGIMARALAGDPGAKITTVAWGSGSEPAKRSDDALGNELQVTAVIEPVGYPTADSVVFSSTMPPGLGTNMRFTEVGLKSADGKLLARFTFPPQDKFDRLRLSVNWQIIFV